MPEKEEEPRKRRARYRVVKGPGGYYVVNNRSGRIYSWNPHDLKRATAQRDALEANFSDRPRKKPRKYRHRTLRTLFLEGRLGEDDPGADEDDDRPRRRRRFAERA